MDIKKKIIIIACDNGLGHVKRCLLIAEQFLLKNFYVELVCCKEKLLKICKVLKISEIPKNINIKINYMSMNETFQSRVKLLDEALDLKVYDLVISDNLIEILYLRPDTVLLANFWWHEVVNYKGEILFSLKKILEERKPVIIGSDIFSTKNVKKNKNFQPIGIITKSIYKGKKINNFKNLLISVGASGNSLNLYSFFFTKYLDLLKSEFDNIYCDPILIHSLRSDSSLIIADYSAEMYQKIDIAIVRPGLGTLVDLLSYKCIPICVYEENFEMINNGQIIEQKKLGFDYGIIDKRKNHLSYLLNKVKGELNIIQNNILSLNMRGLEESVSVLTKQIKMD